MYAAEKYASYVRETVIVFSGIIYFVFFYNDPTTIQWLGNLIVVIANLYGPYVLIAKPYKKYSVFTSSYFTAITDGILIAGWIAATGGINSPFYLIWFISILALAFRFNRKAVVFAMVFNALVYAGLMIFMHYGDDIGLVEPLILRLGFFGTLGWLSIYVTQETLEQTKQKIIQEKLVDEALNTQKSLLKSEQEWKTLVANAPNLIFKVNRQLTITYSNRSIEENDLKELAGSNFLDYFIFVSKEEKEWVTSCFETAFESGEVKTLELVAENDENNSIFFQTNIVPLGKDSDEIMIISTNISKVKEAQKLAEHSLKVKSQFLSNMSHELRTPLNGILGFTKLMKKTKLNNQQLEYLNIIDNSGNHLLNIINDILDLSQIESGKFQFVSEKFNIKHSLENIMAMVMPKVMDKNIQLKLQIDPEIPDYLVGDEVKINQVLINLVNNAIKFTEKGEVKLHAILERINNRVAIINFNVEDTGIGIPDDKLSIIFENFTQLSENKSKLVEGTGLGLTITKRITELLGGSITVSSKVGEGSVFSVTIPTKLAEEEMEDNAEGDYLGIDFSKFNGLNVLVAEDNPINMRLAEIILENWKCNIIKAENGLEAMDKIKSNKVDIVLMDVQMPEQDGLETTRQIRSSDDLKGIPIMGVTAFAQDNEVEKCMESGMDDVITKPFSAELLAGKLDELLTKYSIEP